MLFEEIPAAPPTIKNAGRLGDDAMGPKALLDNGWVVILLGLLIGLAWYNLRKLGRSRRRAA